MAVEPRISLEDAIAIAVEFARGEGIEATGCAFWRHISESEYTREVGTRSGHGNYMIALKAEGGDEVASNGAVEKAVPAITVLVNDQTGSAERFLLL